jgi:hypothetical protein
MKEFYISITVTLLIISWLHAMYRHWRLVKILKANNIPASIIIGGFGLLRDVKNGKDTVKSMEASENRNKLESAVKWADISPFLIFAALVVPFIVLLILNNYGI